MIQTIVLGGGCFWCIEAVFSRVDGVLRVVPGYAGGDKANPKYEDVSSGTSGHAEVVKLEFDDSRIKLNKVLELFFKSHDPTTPNRQGNDVGSQYRSLILYKSVKQRKQIEIFMETRDYDKPIVTEVKKLDLFYPAEDYHKDYFAKHPKQPYCQLVISPKLGKVFGENLK